MNRPEHTERQGHAHRAGARWTLRDSTRPDHDQVDAAFAAHDLSTVDGYGRFLAAQARAFVAIERAVEAAGASVLIGDWAERRRADLLLEDLADLGLEPGGQIAAPAMATDAAVLGAVYVLEGSRLGGAVLSGQAPENAPRRFLGSEGAGPRWRTLVALIDDRLTGEGDIADAVGAARSVFQCFHRAAMGSAAA